MDAEVVTAGPAAELPPAPRTVRWWPALAGWWPLGLLGLLLLASGVGGAVTLWLSGVALPFAHLALDAGASRTAGSIVRVDPQHLRGVDGRPQSRITFRFEAGGRSYGGRGLLADDAIPASMTGIVEFLPDDPTVNRWVGARAPRTDPWLLVGASLAAGLIAGMLWLRAALLRRRVLSEGRVARAEVRAVHSARPAWLLPARVVVDFAFHPAASVPGDGARSGRTVLWRRSAAGRAAAAGASNVDVAFDQRRPLACVIAPDDLLSP